VAQFVEALRYKQEDRGFDFRPHCGPEVDSGSKRYEYQQNFLWGKDAEG